MTQMIMPTNGFEPLGVAFQMYDYLMDGEVKRTADFVRIAWPYDSHYKTDGYRMAYVQQGERWRALPDFPNVTGPQLNVADIKVLVADLWGVQHWTCQYEHCRQPVVFPGTFWLMSAIVGMEGRMCLKDKRHPFPYDEHEGNCGAIAKPDGTREERRHHQAHRLLWASPDHVVSRSRWQPEEKARAYRCRANIVTSCRNCQERKGDYTPDEIGWRRIDAQPFPGWTGMLSVGRRLAARYAPRLARFAAEYHEDRDKPLPGYNRYGGFFGLT